MDPVSWVFGDFIFLVGEITVILVATGFLVALVLVAISIYSIGR
jgi:hypothetical protein